MEEVHIQETGSAGSHMSTVRIQEVTRLFFCFESGHLSCHGDAGSICFFFVVFFWFVGEARQGD